MYPFLRPLAAEAKFKPTSRRTTPKGTSTTPSHLPRRSSSKSSRRTTTTTTSTTTPVSTTARSTTTTTKATTTTTTTTTTTSTTPPPTPISTEIELTRAPSTSTPYINENNTSENDANEDSFFLGNQQIPQSLYESIQQVIAQHLLNQQVYHKTTEGPNDKQTTQSSTTETTTEFSRLSNNKLKETPTTILPGNIAAAFQNYYYQPPGSNESIVYGQGWPSYQPNWYQYAFPPQPIYPQAGINLTNTQYPYFPMINSFVGYQPQFLPNGQHSNAFVELPYMQPSEVTIAPFMKHTDSAERNSQTVTQNPIYTSTSTDSISSTSSKHISTISSAEHPHHHSSASSSKKSSQTWELTDKPVDYLTEKPFDLLRTKQEPPQIQVYIVQGSNGPQVKTKTINTSGVESPNVKVFVIDETKENSRTGSSSAKVDTIKSEVTHKPADNNNNYYSFAYENRPKSTQSSELPIESESSSHYTTPLSAMNGDDETAFNRDIEYDTDSSDSTLTSEHNVESNKLNSLQSLYPGLRNFTDGSLPEAACVRPGLFQHPNDCNKFYQCYWDKFIKKYTLHLFECPVKLAFDSRIVGCSAPSDPTVCVQY